MIKIGQKPATVDTPIEHLTACHRRIEERLDTLERAGGLLAATDESRRAEALQAIASALRFLDSSGVLHTHDEEESLFPRLLPGLEPNEREYVESLEHQHRDVDEAYAELKASLADADPGRYRQAAARLAGLYRKHIASEDQMLTAMARRCLSEADLGEISAEMRQRRNKPRNL